MVNVVHVVGTGTIGEPLIGLLCDFQQELGIDLITFHKRTPRLKDRAKTKALVDRGAHLVSDKENFDAFSAMDIKPEFELNEALERARVVIDCTPGGTGLQNKENLYENMLDNTKGFIAQGSEFGFGKMYARGINDSALIAGEDRFIQVVSCNTHNLASIVNCLALEGEDKDNLVGGRFLLARRANDISQVSGAVPSPQVGKHSDKDFGTHHARDASILFNTMGFELDLFTSAMKLNTQLMHTMQFSLKVKKSTTIQKVLSKFEENHRIALTDKTNVCEVFSFGRDHGHFGRILNQTVVSVPTLHVRNGKEITGFCFTPQDGNSLLSSVAAAVWFLYPHSYESKLKCLSNYLFSEI